MWWSNDFGFNLSFNFIQGKAEEQAVTHVIPIWPWQTTFDSDVCTLLYIYICGYNKGIDDDVDFQVDLKAKAGQGWRQGCARNRRHTQKCQRTLS